MAYTPAGNLTSSAGLAHLQMVYLQKRGLNRLQKKFVFRSICDQESLPLNSGRSIQFFRYTNPSASTTATTEGAVGTSGTLTSRILQATVSQYSSFTTVSDLVKLTAPDAILQSATDLLSYQAGISVDDIVRAVIDAEASSIDLALLDGSFLRASDLRNLRSVLQANDVQPYENGMFKVVAHPYVTYDLVNDPNPLGIAEILKYNTNVMDSPLIKYEDRGHVLNAGGCDVIESTNVTTGGSTYYRAYGFGKGAMACVDLAGHGPSNVIDPSKQRFKINVIPGTMDLANPEGTIGGAVSYNFVFTAVVLDGPSTTIGGVYRMKKWDAYSTIA